MTAGAVAVAVPTEVVGVAATKIIATTKIISAIAAFIVPGSGAIADGFICAADEREATNRLARLLAALAAGNELQDITHGHALFSVGAASRTDIFVQSHAQIVEVRHSAVNLQHQVGHGRVCLGKPSMEQCMDEQTEAAKKAALLMMPYGLYVLGAKNGRDMSAGTVNWVMQTSFKPPLVAMGVKKDSGLYGALKSAGSFALSFLESGQKDIAYAFFKPTNVDGQTINGHAFETESTGAPIISAAPAWVEGRIVGEVEIGDHSCLVGEVTNAGVKRESKLLTLEEVGVKYGG